MTLDEQFERITSNKEEHARLYESDNLYIVWAVKKDDPKLEGFINSIDKEYYNWRSTLNGTSKRDSKLANAETENLEVRGHIYSVTNEQMDMFEKIALMPSMKYGYRFEKYDVNNIKHKEQQEIMEVLKEETNGESNTA
jgi:hypothetical protein